MFKRSGFSRALTRPRRRNSAGFLYVVYDQDQLIVVITVHHLDVDSGVTHSPSELAELAWHRLIQALNDNLALGEHLDAFGLECFARRGSVLEEEVRDTFSVDDPGAALPRTRMLRSSTPNENAIAK